MSTLAVRNIGELCTCDAAQGDDLGVVRDATLIAHDGVITYAGPSRGVSAEQLAAVDEEIDARGAAVVPGFVDAHTHAIWMGDRGAEYAARAAGSTYEEIAAAGSGIAATVRATAAADAGALVAAARPRLAAMLRQGTTTVEVKSGYGGTEDAEMRMLDAAAILGADADLPDVVATYLPLHAPPDGDRDAFLTGVCTEGVAAAARRARFVDAFCERGAYSVAECERLFTAAREHGLGVKVHAEQRTHSGGALLAARCGAVSADHLEHATDQDIRALAAAGVVGVLLPGASLVLGGPPPPGRRLRDAGATVAVATDCNPGTCYSESMPLMLSLAVALAGLTPAEALLAATAGGGAALALRDRGRLAPGARCDAVLLAAPHWTDVAYHLGGDVVDRVILGGRLLPTTAASRAATR